MAPLLVKGGRAEDRGRTCLRLRPGLGYGSAVAYSVLRRRTIHTTMTQNVRTNMFTTVKKVQ